ncbi:MAG: hypothetical protein JKY92_00015 [Magnetovibrio sp.]|nr:hypothetical protein [Magnetovibrio sp.]
MAKLSKAFISLILDKKAREALKNRPQAPTPSAKAGPNTALNLGAGRPPEPVHAKPVDTHPSPQAIRDRLDQAEQEMEKNRSPERLQLIQSALKIRHEQSKLLEQLSDEQREKLQSLAVKSFLGGETD